jgi:hypothetical protein
MRLPKLFSTPCAAHHTAQLRPRRGLTLRLQGLHRLCLGRGGLLLARFRRRQHALARCVWLAAPKQREDVH